MLDMLLTKLSTPDWSEDEFNKIKVVIAELQDDEEYTNHQIAQAVNIASHVKDTNSPLFSKLKTGVQDLTFDDFKSKWTDYFKDGYSTTFVTGNVDQKTAKNLYKELDGIFPSSTSKEDSSVYQKNPILLEGKSYVIRKQSSKYTDSNHALVNYYQFPPPEEEDVSDLANMLLLQSLMHS